MKISSKFSLALLAGTILSTPAGAAVINDFADMEQALSAGGDYTLGADISADKDFGSVTGNLTIDGAGHGIDGSGHNGLVINNGATVNVANIGGENTAWRNTAYIFINNGTLNIDSVVFKENETNSTSQTIGGIIQNRGQIGNLTNITADGNRIINPADEVWGGLIANGNDNTGATGHIERIADSSFTNNYIYSTNYAPHGGIILNLDSSIGTIENVLFEGNVMESAANSLGGAHGVAIDNNVGGTINLISNVRFINNKLIRTGTDDVPSNLNYHGSAAALDNYNVINKITNSLFEGNTTSCENCDTVGGAIMNMKINDVDNKGYIGSIENTVFKNNVITSEKLDALGGAIYNTGDIGSMTNVTFENNKAVTNGTDRSSALGGAIYNTRKIGNISGEGFSNNSIASKSGYAYGAAIYNDGTIESITADFKNNTITEGKSRGEGAAIYNERDGVIGNIIGNFTENHTSVAGYSFGGAIHNDYYAEIGNIIGDFINNSVNSTAGNSGGGAIYVNLNGSGLGNVIGDFIGNSASSTAHVSGGAIDAGNIDSITGNFLNNYAKTTSSYYVAMGGAVDQGRQMRYKTGGEIRYFSGNYTEDNVRKKNYNALFVYSSSATNPTAAIFDTSGGGAWIINDNIEGGISASTSSSAWIEYDRHFKLTLIGDDMLNDDGRTTQYIAINNDIINAGIVTVDNTTLKFGAYQHEDTTARNWDGHGRFVAALNTDGTADLEAAAVTSLSLTNAAFDLYNNHPDEVKLAGWSANNGYLHIDVDVDNLTADMLNINGNVEGQTKLVLYPNSDKDITGKSIVFAQSANDTTGNKDSFTVYRVYRSPYMFGVEMTGEGTTNHEWYLTMTDEKNEFAGVEPGEQPDPEVPDVDIPDIDIPDINIPTAPVYGEVVAYGALPAAALEQTRNMVDNIGNQIKNGRVYTRSCSFVDGYWDGEPYYNLWVNPTYYTSNIDSPFAIDADIWGIEAGGDIQHDIHNRLGIFVSYRQGEYDMNGNGDKYRSPVGSEIDIDSYIAGLYYRYDHNNWYAFATLYGGIQEADIKTDDGMKSDTDGVEFGASAEVGYDYALTDSVTLTPELGVFYTQVNYDDATDSMGKRASYDDARQIELEAGVKLAKTFMTDESFANVYVKPSVVQTIVDRDEVNITGLGDVEALDDATLGRIEIGGRYGFTTNLSAYGWANYTFGSDYDATTFGLGLNYAF